MRRWLFHIGGVCIVVPCWFGCWSVCAHPFLVVSRLCALDSCVWPSCSSAQVLIVLCVLLTRPVPLFLLGTIILLFCGLCGGVGPLGYFSCPLLWHHLPCSGLLGVQGVFLGLRLFPFPTVAAGAFAGSTLLAVLCSMLWVLLVTFGLHLWLVVRVSVGAF